MDRPAVVAVVLVMLAIADIARAHDYIKQLSGHVELSEEQLREEFAKVKLSPKELDALEDFLPRLSFQRKQFSSALVETSSKTEVAVKQKFVAILFTSINILMAAGKIVTTIINYQKEVQAKNQALRELKNERNQALAEQICHNSLTSYRVLAQFQQLIDFVFRLLGEFKVKDCASQVAVSCRRTWFALKKMNKEDAASTLAKMKNTCESIWSLLGSNQDNHIVFKMLARVRCTRLKRQRKVAAKAVEDTLRDAANKAIAICEGVHDLGGREGVTAVRDEVSAAWRDVRIKERVAMQVGLTAIPEKNANRVHFEDTKPSVITEANKKLAEAVEIRENPGDPNSKKKSFMAVVMNVAKGGVVTSLLNSATGSEKAQLASALKHAKLLATGGKTVEDITKTLTSTLGGNAEWASKLAALTAVDETEFAAAQKAAKLNHVAFAVGCVGALVDLGVNVHRNRHNKRLFAENRKHADQHLKMGCNSISETAIIASTHQMLLLTTTDIITELLQGEFPLTPTFTKPVGRTINTIINRYYKDDVFLGGGYQGYCLHEDDLDGSRSNCELAVMVSRLLMDPAVGSTILDNFLKGDTGDGKGRYKVRYFFLAAVSVVRHLSSSLALDYDGQFSTFGCHDLKFRAQVGYTRYFLFRNLFDQRPLSFEDSTKALRSAGEIAANSREDAGQQCSVRAYLNVLLGMLEYMQNTGHYKLKPTGRIGRSVKNAYENYLKASPLRGLAASIPTVKGQYVTSMSKGVDEAVAFLNQPLRARRLDLSSQLKVDRQARAATYGKCVFHAKYDQCRIDHLCPQDNHCGKLDNVGKLGDHILWYSLRAGGFTCPTVQKNPLLEGLKVTERPPDLAEVMKAGITCSECLGRAPPGCKHKDKRKCRRSSVLRWGWCKSGTGSKGVCKPVTLGAYGAPDGCDKLVTDRELCPSRRKRSNATAANLLKTITGSTRPRESDQALTQLVHKLMAGSTATPQAVLNTAKQLQKEKKEKQSPNSKWATVAALAKQRKAETAGKLFLQLRSTERRQQVVKDEKKKKEQKTRNPIKLISNAIDKAKANHQLRKRRKQERKERQKKDEKLAAVKSLEFVSTFRSFAPKKLRDLQPSGHLRNFGVEVDKCKYSVEHDTIHSDGLVFNGLIKMLVYGFRDFVKASRGDFKDGEMAHPGLELKNVLCSEDGIMNTTLYKVPDALAQPTNELCALLRCDGLEELADYIVEEMKGDLLTGKYRYMTTVDYDFAYVFSEKTPRLHPAVWERVVTKDRRTDLFDFFGKMFKSDIHIPLAARGRNGKVIGEPSTGCHDPTPQQTWTGCRKSVAYREVAKTLSNTTRKTEKKIVKCYVDEKDKKRYYTKAAGTCERRVRHSLGPFKWRGFSCSKDADCVSKSCSGYCFCATYRLNECRCVNPFDDLREQCDPTAKVEVL